jgi:hypothetical protein
VRASLLFIAAVLLWGCERPEVVNDDTVCTAVRALPVADAGFYPYGHSHNDYEHATPLFEALDQRFYSVEADVWLRSGKVVVSHDSYSSRGTLEELYLDPLRTRIDEMGGSVHGDGLQFVLWLDLKDGSAGLRDNLTKLLEAYPMLSVFTDDGEQPGPVVVVLTGNEASKKVFVEADVRRAVRDSNLYDPNDPAADHRWRYYALDWQKWINWNGEEGMPEAERRRLHCVVGDIHHKGKKVRFWAAPSTPGYWEELIAAGADFVGTDDLVGLGDFLGAVQP